MRLFVLLVAACLIVKTFVAWGQPLPFVGVEHPPSPITNDFAIVTASPDGGVGAADIQELAREVARLRAAAVIKPKDGGAEWRMAIAALIAFVLKWTVSALKKIKTEELSDKAKQIIPWIVMVLGVVVAVAAHYGMNENWTNAIILGGGPPGAVLFHNLWESFVNLIKKKPAEPPRAVF